METGLYGQSERGDYFGVRAFENRLADVNSEGVHDGIRSESQYIELMATLIIVQIRANKKERQFAALIEEEKLNGRGTKNLLVGILYRSLGMNEQDLKEALQKQADLTEEMRADGFHINVIYGTFGKAFYRAMELLPEIQRVEREHKNRSLGIKKPIIDSADKPRSRIGRSCTGYRIEEHSALHGQASKSSKLWKR